MDQTHRFYFETAVSQGLAELRGIDLALRAGTLGVDVSGGVLLIPFFGRLHRVSADGISDASGTSCTPAVANLLLGYVLRCPATAPEAEDWITFREFSGAGPLM